MMLTPYLWFAVAGCAVLFTACENEPITQYSSCDEIAAKGQIEFLLIPDADSEEPEAGFNFYPDEIEVLKSIPWATRSTQKNRLTMILPYSRSCIDTHEISQNVRMPAEIQQAKNCDFSIELSSITDTSCNSL